MSFKVDDLVAIKIHKADKVSNLHANMLIAKILRIDSTTNYVKVVTQYGIIKGQIIQAESLYSHKSYIQLESRSNLYLCMYTSVIII